jgi:carbonic anhydrase
LTTPTPTCSEGLTWIVMRDKLHTTPQVIAKFHDIMGDNYRRTQPLNGRQINCCGESDTIN